MGNEISGIVACGLYWDGWPWQEIPAGNTIHLNTQRFNGIDDLEEMYIDVITELAVLHPDGLCLNTWEKNKYDANFGPGVCFDHRGGKD